MKPVPVHSSEFCNSIFGVVENERGILGEKGKGLLSGRLS